MSIDSILAAVDHTLLAPASTWEDIKSICDDGVKYRTASVCIPPAYVARAKAYTEGQIAVCTVIGFPNGYNTTRAKVFETRDAVESGADEIDMVINIGALKDQRYGYILDEIKAIKEACGDKILKVIVETCLLTEEEKVKICEIVTEAGADFIKTSTGFSAGGATREDISMFAAHVGPAVKIKAAGGIKSLDDARDFLDLGASRLGTSSIVKIVKNEQTTGY